MCLIEITLWGIIYINSDFAVVGRGMSGFGISYLDETVFPLGQFRSTRSCKPSRGVATALRG